MGQQPRDALMQRGLVGLRGRGAPPRGLPPVCPTLGGSEGAALAIPGLGACGIGRRPEPGVVMCGHEIGLLYAEQLSGKWQVSDFMGRSYGRMVWSGIGWV